MSEVQVFMGVIGSGKDYRSNKLKEAGHTRADFKDALIDMVSDIAGYDIRPDYDWFKEHPVGVMRPSNPLAEAMLHSEWVEILRKHPEIITGRKLLTRVGTEAIRKRHPNYWVDQFLAAAAKSLAEGIGVANADCRFFNEIEAIQNLHERIDGEAFRVPATFTFCNFKSDRYNPKLNHGSEKLAQTLLSLGLDDGDNITDQHFVQAAKMMGESYAPLD